MTIMSGARAFLEMLRAEGVEVIFGNPGTSESAIMALLPEYPDIRYMLATQEGVAMGMADGYSVAGNRPAVVNLHIETGLANGISLLHHAMDGGVPLILTAGNKDVRKLTEYRTDLAGMVASSPSGAWRLLIPSRFPGSCGGPFKRRRTHPPALFSSAFPRTRWTARRKWPLSHRPRRFCHRLPRWMMYRRLPGCWPAPPIL